MSAFDMHCAAGTAVRQESMPPPVPFGSYKFRSFSRDLVDAAIRLTNDRCQRA